MIEKKLTTAQLAIILSVLGILSKLTGFIRELILANYFGAGAVTDAYVMSMSIPNTILGGIIGACTTAYMPVLASKNSLGEDKANEFTTKLVNAMMIVVAICAALGWIFADQLTSLFVPGYTGLRRSLTIFYMRIAFVMMIFYVLSTIMGSYLEFRGVFVAPTLFNYFQNAFIIIAIIVSAKSEIPEILIFGVASGYVLMGVGKVFIAQKVGYRHTAALDFKETFYDILALALPVFLGSSAGEVNAFVDKLLASNLVEGSTSALNYGQLFVGVVSAVTTGVFLTIIYPRLAKAVAEEDYDKVSFISQKGFSLILVILLPMMLGSILYSEAVVQVVYERGAFGEGATALTSAAFKYYSIGMLFSGVSGLVSKLYYSYKDTKTGVYVSLMSIVCNIVLNITLVKVMAHAGLALATSICQIFSTTVLYIWFQKKHPEIVLFKDWGKALKTVIFSVVSVGASYAFYIFVGEAVWMPRMILLAISVLIAVVIYFVLLIVAKFDDVELIWSIFRRGRKED